MDKVDLQNEIDIKKENSEEGGLRWNIKKEEWEIEQVDEKEEFLSVIEQSIERNFICPLCDASYCYNATLNRHVTDNHTGVRKLQCSECDYQTFSEIGLKIHGQARHGLWNMGENDHTGACSFCDMRFSSKDDLKEHLEEVHSNLKPFRCCKCNFSASFERELTAHINSSHVNVKNLSCKLCGNTFSTLTSLKRHANSRHRNNKSCNKCSYKAVSLRALKRHIVNIHDKIENFLCDHCDNSFQSKYSLTRHIAAVHEKKDYFTQALQMCFTAEGLQSTTL